MPIEKLTPERRRQQTRDVLIAAATEVFAERGFEGASLEEIAATAGFSRGAIYKNFGSKEELFFAVLDNANERGIASLTELLHGSTDSGEKTIRQLAERWRAGIAEAAELITIRKEYELFALRNPGAGQRNVQHRRRTHELVTALIEDVADRTGLTPRLPAPTIASIILAAADGLVEAERIDGEDLFLPFLQLLSR